MQEFSGKKTATVTSKSARRMVCPTIAVLAMLLSGCAVAKSTYRFSAKSVTRITYDPRNCAETLDGRFKCREVVFTVNSIEPVKNK